MKLIPTLNRVLRPFTAKVLWLHALILLLACILYGARSATLATNDLLCCGRYPTTYLYITLNWRFTAVRLDTYHMDAFRVADPPHGIFLHATGLSMAAATPATSFDSQTQQGWDHFKLTHYNNAGRKLHTAYFVNIPFFIPILAILSAVYVAISWPFKRLRPSGLCPTCRYDLRAHQPGQKCPECGTLIPPTTASSTPLPATRP